MLLSRLYRICGMCLVACVALCMCLCSVADLHAEVVVLRSGQKVTGEVLLRNEEVLIVRTQSGARYQYPISEIVSVEKESLESTAKTGIQQDTVALLSSDKRVSIYAGATGGAAYLPMVGWGGSAGANLLIGSHHLGARRIFVGGGIGVQAAFVGGKDYAFLPIMLATHIPFSNALHSPCMGMALGYAFSVNNNASGGLYTSVDVGWNYCFSAKSSLLLAANVQWQQLSVRVSEQIEGTTYDHTIGTNMLLLGLKIGIQF